MDVAFGLPDAIFSLSEEQREARAKTQSDLCSLDDKRYFIRGVVYVPVQELGTKFGWGDRYHELYDKDGSNEPPSAGVLANTPPGYAAVEQPLEIHYGPADKRPIFKPTPTDGEFYHEQIHGLPVRKWHGIIEHYVG
jgi:hypothetical protein